ncbi:unnamed protein product [Allacma fusca]|uniref:DDE Tnp4 domain-containing protein n=1 Tax=Allacma fusca TaxID=39272 RepID=A0A8J2NMN5_9HEXA|nr:unnamed protein product [Allacma fusca]
MGPRRVNQALVRECYICSHAIANPRQMRKLSGDENMDIRIIAEEHRKNARLEAKEVEVDDRMCHTCHQRIVKSIECSVLPHGVRFLVVPINHDKCFICFGSTELRDVCREARINVYIETELFIPARARCCGLHFLSNWQINPIWLEGLFGYDSFVELNGPEMREWLQHMRGTINADKKKRMGNINLYSDLELKTLCGLTREQFNNLYSYTTRAVVQSSVVYVRDLLIFLVKMRTGLSDEFLRVMFNVSRVTISRTVSNVRQNLELTFTDNHIGLAAHPRDQFIQHYVPDFAQKLYNQDDPTNKKVILCADSTYIYMHKSSNYRVLRQTFSVYKGRHLVKIHLLVSCNGRILVPHGPYFADGKNNDASILRNEFEKDMTSLKEWMQDGDVIIADRGYRDSLEYLRALGIKPYSPAFLLRGQKQHTTYDANMSRIPAKNRWVVEAINGHIKSIWRFLQHDMPVMHVKHIRSFFRIACALLNAYYCPITMEHATPALAQLMLDRIRHPNVVQAMVEVEPELLRPRRDWIDLTSEDLPQFPRLSLEYLKLLTFGTYQVNLANKYVHDKVQRESEYRIQVVIERQGLLRVRIYSKHRNAVKYNCFVAYTCIQEGGEGLNIGGNETETSAADMLPTLVDMTIEEHLDVDCNIEMPILEAEDRAELLHVEDNMEERVVDDFELMGDIDEQSRAPPSKIPRISDPGEGRSDGRSHIPFHTTHLETGTYLASERSDCEQDLSDVNTSLNIMHNQRVPIQSDESASQNLVAEAYDQDLDRLRREYEEGVIEGYARYNQVKYPSNDLIRIIEDCGNRELPEVQDANELPRPTSPEI